MIVTEGRCGHLRVGGGFIVHLRLQDFDVSGGAISFAELGSCTADQRAAFADAILIEHGLRGGVKLGLGALLSLRRLIERGFGVRKRGFSAAYLVARIAQSCPVRRNFVEYQNRKIESCKSLGVPVRAEVGESLFQRDAHGTQLGLSLGHILDRLVEHGAATLEVSDGVRLIENRLVLDGECSRLFEVPYPFNRGVHLPAGIIRPCVQGVEPVDAVGGEVGDVRQIFQPSLCVDEVDPVIPRAFEVLVTAKLRLHAEAMLAHGVEVVLYAF